MVHRIITDQPQQMPKKNPQHYKQIKRVNLLSSMHRIDWRINTSKEKVYRNAYLTQLKKWLFKFDNSHEYTKL